MMFPRELLIFCTVFRDFTRTQLYTTLPNKYSLHQLKTRVPPLGNKGIKQSAVRYRGGGG